jgi:hypothetical protein
MLPRGVRHFTPASAIRSECSRLGRCVSHRGHGAWVEGREMSAPISPDSKAVLAQYVQRW